MSAQIPPAECSVVDFKEEWTENTRKTFCAFLNSHGGRVFLGVSDNGEAIGVQNSDEIEMRVHSIFKFAIRPDASRSVHTETQVIGRKKIVVVTVLEGSEPPYYVTVNANSKKASRVCFIRQGSRSYEATENEIRGLYEKGHPSLFEARPSIKQDLTFHSLEKFFKQAEIVFNERKFQILGIQNVNGFYTNLGFWLSDQCTMETRVGFFLGTSKASQADGIYTFTGCIAEQYSKIRELLRNRFGFKNQIDPYSLKADGLRNEVSDYPEKAIREALVNIFAHRDYSLQNAQATISCFADRMEFLSFGGLPRGITREMMLLGASVPRNRALADVLLRLSAMEKYGIGIPTIFACYEGLSIQPQLICNHEYIQVVLPKVKILPESLTERERRVIEFIKTNRESSRREIQAYLNVSYGTALGTLNSLEVRGLIEKLGSGRTVRYSLKTNIS